MKKMVFAAIVSLVIGAGSLAASPSIKDLTDGLDAFTDKVTNSLPFAASAGLDWSNAWIGNIVNSDFPYVHFGLGLSAGLTTIPSAAVKPLVDAFGGDIGGLDYMPLPFTVLSARIGGIVLPFDVGIKVGFIPDSLATSVKDYKFGYNNFGFDVRYNLVKSDFVLPDVSVGAGINFLNADVTATYGSNITYADPNAPTKTVTISAPTAKLSLRSTEFEAKVQVSKTFFWFLTPYLGAGLGYGTGHAGADVSTNVSFANSNQTYWQDNYGINFGTTGFSQSKDSGVFGARLFGGTSVNILILKVDVQGMYSVIDGSLGLNVGARIQF